MRRVLKFLLSLVIGLVVFLIVMQRVGWESVKQALLFFFNFQGLVIVSFTFLFALLGILKWRLILKSQGHCFSFKDLTPLWFLGFTISYLTPVALFGGEIFRIYFTKKRFPSLAWEKNMASVACDKILDATVFFVFLIVGVLVFAFYGRFPTSFLGVSVLVVAGALLSLLGIFYFKRWKKESVLEWLMGVFGIKKEKLHHNKNSSVIFEAEKEVFRFFSLKEKFLWKALGLTFLHYMMSFFRAASLIFFLTGNVAILKSLAVYGFANLAALMPLPATLGALELGEGFAFMSLGLGFSTGIVFSMVWRGADLLLCLLGVLFSVKLAIDLAQGKILKFFER